MRWMDAEESGLQPEIEELRVTRSLHALHPSFADEDCRLSCSDELASVKEVAWRHTAVDLRRNFHGNVLTKRSGS